MSEERYPLLLLYVEENGKRSEFPQRVVFADKGRGNAVAVTKGAAVLITQWPAQVTSCWLTSIALGSSFILIMLILLMSSLQPLQPLHPRCVRDVDRHLSNRSVHLVKAGSHWNTNQLDILKFIAETYSDFDIHVITVESSMNKFKPTEKPVKHHSNKPESHQKYLHIGKNKSEPDKLVNLPTLQNNSFFKTLNELFLHEPPQNVFLREVSPSKSELLLESLAPRNEDKRDERHSRKNKHTTSSPLFINRIKRSARLLRENTMDWKTYEDVVKSYDNIKEIRTTFKRYFIGTPLQYFWMDLDQDMLVFAIRVQELWQNGGISFYLAHHKNHSLGNELSVGTTAAQTNGIIEEKTKNATNTEWEEDMDDAMLSIRMKVLIANVRSRFEALPNDLVSVDGRALHMATKTPCHTFFGEMLIKLQRDIDNTSIPEFIQNTLNTFCGRGAVDSDYCKKLRK